MRNIILAGIAAVSALAAPAIAQQDSSRIITIYRAAPGHQEQLIQWLARQEEISRAAGVPAAQLYVHQSGASWDFLVVAPDTTDAQDSALDEAALRLNAPTGPRVGLELRQHVSEHTDTYVAGPTTAAEYLARLRPASR